MAIICFSLILFLFCSCSWRCRQVLRELFVKLKLYSPMYSPAWYDDTDAAFAIRAAGYNVWFTPFAEVGYCYTQKCLDSSNIHSIVCLYSKLRNVLLNVMVPTVAAATGCGWGDSGPGDCGVQAQASGGESEQVPEQVAACAQLPLLA